MNGIIPNTTEEEQDRANRLAYFRQFEVIMNSPEVIRGLAVNNLPIGTIGAMMSWDERLKGDGKTIPHGAIVEVMGEPVIEENKEDPRYTIVTIAIRCYQSNMGLTREGDIRTGRLQVMRDGTIRGFERARTDEVAGQLRAGFAPTSTVSSEMNDRANEALTTR